MIDIFQTDEYKDWFVNLADREAQLRIASRLKRVEQGNFGDCEPVGEGVSELRFHFGPGYRVYFIKDGLQVIVLLGGGDKSSQAGDIKVAKNLARALKEDRQ